MVRFGPVLSEIVRNPSRHCALCRSADCREGPCVRCECELYFRGESFSSFLLRLFLLPPISFVFLSHILCSCIRKNTLTMKVRVFWSQTLLSRLLYAEVEVMASSSCCSTPVSQSMLGACACTILNETLRALRHLERDLATLAGILLLVIK